jgi:hypothetical protein
MFRLLSDFYPTHTDPVTMASLLSGSRIAIRSLNRHARFRRIAVRWESSISQRPGSDTYVKHSPKKTHLINQYVFANIGGLESASPAQSTANSHLKWPSPGRRRYLPCPRIE